MTNKMVRKGIYAACMMVMLFLFLAKPVYAAEGTGNGQAIETVENDGATGDRALAAGLVVGLAAAAGAIGMGMAISKSAESMSRQPEVEGGIRTSLMLGLVFIETAIIYALIVAILIIFVM